MERVKSSIRIVFSSLLFSVRVRFDYLNFFAFSLDREIKEYIVHSNLIYWEISIKNNV